MPLLDCSIGDELIRRNEVATVIGFHKESGDLYLESPKGYPTVTSKTASSWSKFQERDSKSARRRARKLLLAKRSA